MRRLAGLVLVVVIATACHDGVTVEVPQGNIVGALVAVDGPAIGFGLPAWTDDGASADITSIEVFTDDEVSTCTATVEFWTTTRPIGAVWMDEAQWGFEPFESFVVEGPRSPPQLVASVAPDDDCVPGDVIEFSGYRLGYDDRGFPKWSTSPMRFEVDVVDESTADRGSAQGADRADVRDRRQGHQQPGEAEERNEPGRDDAGLGVVCGLCHGLVSVRVTRV